MHVYGREGGSHSVFLNLELVHGDITKVGECLTDTQTDRQTHTDTHTHTRKHTHNYTCINT